MAEVLPLENHHDSQMLDEVIIRPRTEQNNHLTMSYEKATPKYLYVYRIQAPVK